MWFFSTIILTFQLPTYNYNILQLSQTDQWEKVDEYIKDPVRSIWEIDEWSTIITYGPLKN